MPILVYWQFTKYFDKVFQTSSQALLPPSLLLLSNIYIYYIIYFIS